MNSTAIINASRRGTGLKGWYMNKTLSGKRLVKKALESKYGKQEAVLPGGILKHVEKERHSTTTKYLNKYYNVIQTTLRNYDKNGNRFNLTSHGEDPKDYHHRTSLQVTNWDKLGRRESIFKRLSYNSDNGFWDINFMEKTTIKQADDGITIKKFIKDYIKQTTESFTENVPQEKLDRILKLFNIIS